MLVQEERIRKRGHLIRSIYRNRKFERLVLKDKSIDMTVVGRFVVTEMLFCDFRDAGSFRR